MTEAELNTLEDLLSRPEVTMIGWLSETDVVQMHPRINVAYVRRRCPDDPRRMEDYPAHVQIELDVGERMTIEELRRRALMMLEDAQEAEQGRSGKLNGQPRETSVLNTYAENEDTNGSRQQFHHS